MQKDKIAAPSEPARARLKGWVKAAFIASITLNLLVVGVVVGGIIRHDRHPPRPMISDVSIGPFTEALSQDDREALRRAAQRESTGFRAMRQAAREDYRRL
ncbi:MAG: periplasmic heavy metal sensor, partial [Rhodobacteraceae bacterium]|nr:periplasmic heavy metal sensor [Paracoccaceae bacterium]